MKKINQQQINHKKFDHEGPKKSITIEAFKHQNPPKTQG
jgi:hypothetical protein